MTTRKKKNPFRAVQTMFKGKNELDFAHFLTNFCGLTTFRQEKTNSAFRLEN